MTTLEPTILRHPYLMGPAAKTPDLRCPEDHLAVADSGRVVLDEGRPNLATPIVYRRWAIEVRGEGVMSKRSLVLLASLLAAATSAAAVSVPSGAQTVGGAGLVSLRASTSPPVPARSVALGRMPASTRIHLDVTLKLPDPSAVTSFIASLSDRSSPEFDHYLGAGQFGQLFGPSLSEVAAVDAVLRSDGLDPGQVTSDHLSIPITAPAALIDRAFHVNLVRYKLAGGRVAFTSLSSPSISSTVAPDIEGVIGLNDLVQPQSLLVRLRSQKHALRSSADVAVRAAPLRTLPHAPKPPTPVA